MRPTEDLIIAAVLPKARLGNSGVYSELDFVLQQNFDESYFNGPHKILFRLAVTSNVLNTPLDDETLVALLEQENVPNAERLQIQITYRDLSTVDVTREKLRILLPSYRERVHAERMASALEEAAAVLTDGMELDGEVRQGYKVARTHIMARLSELDQKEQGTLPSQDIRECADELLTEYEETKKGREPGIMTGWSEIDALTNGFQKGELAIFCAYTGEGKALALDTPIATPSGWSTMGELKVGDLVFDETGTPTRIIYKSPVQMKRECFRVVFRDGEEIIADAEHLWATREWMWKEDRPLAVKTTAQMADTVMQCGRPRYAIPMNGALDLPAVDLPLDPYVLGVWLGDGDSNDGNVTCDERDDVLPALEAAFPRAERFGCSGQAVRLRLEPRGDISPVCKRGHARKEYNGKLQCPTCAKLHARAKRKGESLELLQPGNEMQSFKAALRDLGVLGNKHVPAIYLRSSYGQRLALLQGLMDTDGYVSARGQCEFVSMLEPLARAVEELARSLGIKTGWTTGRAMLKGKDCGTKYRVRFTTDVPVFRMSRKLERLQAARPDVRTRRRYITAIEPVASVPVQCIGVEAASHLFLAGRSMVPTHNTQTLLNVGYHAAVYQQKNVVFVSLEMPMTQVRRRIIARHTNHYKFGLPGGLDYQRIKNGKLDFGEERLYSDVIKDWRDTTEYGRFHVLQISKYDTVKVLNEKLMYLRSRMPIDLVVLDYASLLASVRRRSDRREEIVEVIEGLKALCLTFNEGEGICCVTANQISRKARDEAEQLRRYGLNFASETSAIEKNADFLAWLLRLDEFRVNKEVLMGVAKYRDGDVGTEFRLMERYESSLLADVR